MNIQNVSFTETYNGVSVTGSYSETGYRTGTVYLDYVNDQRIVDTYCSAEDYFDPYIASLTGLINERYLESEPDLPGYCPNETKRFSRLDANHYKADVFCEDELWMTLNFAWLHAGPDFDEGSLSMVSSNYSDMGTNHKVCAVLEQIVSTEDYPQPNDLNLSNSEVTERFISVMTQDYQGKPLELLIRFADEIQPGDYVIMDGYPLLPGKVEARLTSPVFGGTNRLPKQIMAISGTVTITEITRYKAVGSYDFQTAGEGSFNGSFSVDLNG